MAVEYSVEVCRKLEAEIHAAQLCRPMRISRFDAGTELTYDVRGFGQAETAHVHLVVEKFIGGGFAGQVYLVKLAAIEGVVEGLREGEDYALKILIPPSGFSRLFRNLLYWVGFQGLFQLQVNPSAAEAGALAIARGGMPEQAARAALPGWARGGMTVRRAVCAVHVQMRPPRLLPWVGGLLRVRASAAVAAPGPLDPHSIELLAEPADPDPEVQPTSREVVDVGRLLGRVDGVALGNQTDPRP